MRVCNKCFEEYCSCIDKEMIKIDKLMLDAIKILNQKGYKTVYCCSGHLEEGVLNKAYIMFDKAYLFECFDDFNIESKYNFKIKHLGTFVNVRTQIECIIPSKWNTGVSNKALIEINYDFYKWASKIPTYDEHKNKVLNCDHIRYDGKKDLSYSSYKIKY